LTMSTRRIATLVTNYGTIQIALLPDRGDKRYFLHPPNRTATVRSAD